MIDLPEMIQVLARTPGTLRALLEGLSEPWLTCTEGPDTFSPLDVLGHLIYGEETDWMPRLRIILEHGPEHPFEPWDRFAFRTRLAGVALARIIHHVPQDASCAASDEVLEGLQGLANAE